MCPITVANAFLSRQNATVLIFSLEIISGPVSSAHCINSYYVKETLGSIYLAKESVDNNYQFQAL